MKLSNKLGIIALIAISMRMYGMDVGLQERPATPTLHKANVVRPDRLSARTNGQNVPIEFQMSTVGHRSLTLVPNQITKLLPIPVISSAKKSKAGKAIDTYGPRLALIQIASSPLIPPAIRREITRELGLNHTIPFDQALRNKRVNFSAYIAITGYIPNGNKASLYSLQLHPWHLGVEKTPGKKAAKVGILKPYAGIRGIGGGAQNAPFNHLTSSRTANIQEDVVQIPGEFGQMPEVKSTYSFIDQNVRFGLAKDSGITTFWAVAVNKPKNAAIVTYYIFAHTKTITDKLFNAVKNAKTVRQLTNNMKILARTLTRTDRITLDSELYTALVAGNKASVDNLFAKGENLRPTEIHKANTAGETPLVMAIKLGVEKLAKDLIDAGAQFEEKMVDLSARNTALRRMLENKWAERECPICMAVPEVGHELHEFPPRGYTGCICNIKTKMCDACAYRLLHPERHEVFGVTPPKCPYCRGQIKKVPVKPIISTELLNAWSNKDE